MGSRFARLPDWVRPALAPECGPDGVGVGVALQFALAARLWEYRNNGTGLVWPKVETLAEDLALSGRTVQRALRVLERRGIIVRLTGNGGRSKAAVWSLPDIGPVLPDPGKGDVHDTLSAPERVTCTTVKGDVHDRERVTCTSPARNQTKELDEELEDPSTVRPSVTKVMRMVHPFGRSA